MRNVSFRSFCLALGLFCTVAMAGEAPAPAYLHTGPVFLENIRIIDGLGNPPVEGQDVLVLNGKIDKIAPHGQIEPPRDAHIIAGAGKTVLPGLIEGHSHLLSNSLGGQFTALEVWRPLMANLYAGVTTVSDLGSSLQTAADLRDAVDAGRLAGPTLHTVGDVFEEANERDNFLASRQLGRMGDYIKLLDMHQQREIKLIKGYVVIPLIRMQQLATEAKLRNMRLVVDVAAWIGTSAYMRAGVDGFAHVAFTHLLTPEEIEEARRRGVWSIGTAAVIHQFDRKTNRMLSGGTDFLDDPLISGFYSADELAPIRPVEYSERVIEAFVADAKRAYGPAFFADDFPQWPSYALRNIKALLDAGVLVGLGTDPIFPGLFHGEAMHYEMAVWARSGIANLAVISSATHGNARILQIDHEVGSVQENMIADLLVVSGNPAQNIAHTRNIVAVIKHGRVVDRQSLLYRTSPAARDQRSAASQGPAQ